MMDLTGKRFGKLVAIKEVDRKYHYLCKCDCGNESVVSKYNLKRTKSCGCLEGNHRHGLANTKLYSIWVTMKQRCYNKNKEHYEYYGGRGIVVCNEWKNDFKTFYDWAIKNGYSDKLELDRINNDGKYEPNNCRLVTHRENVLNQRLLKTTNTSGYCGVHFRGSNKKWIAKITIKGKHIYLGIFTNKHKAVRARNKYIIANNLQDDYKVQKIKRS